MPWSKRRSVPGGPADDPVPIDPTSDLVTESDIRATYRLLLNRHASPAEIEHKAHLVGSDRVETLVGRIFESREFQMGRLWQTLTRLTGSEQPEVSLVELPGRRMYVDAGDQFIGIHIAEKGEYEPHLTAAITDVLKPGDSFVDVGANIGWYAILAASIVGPTGSVLAVDVDPQNVEVLNRSLAANNFTNTAVIPIALSDSVGTVVLQKLRGSNNQIVTAGDEREAPNRNMTALPLDVLVRGLARKIDVVKIDVEGAEFFVLKGAEETVREYRPVIFLEFTPDAIERLPGSSGDRLQDWIAGHDYTIEGVSEDASDGLVPMAHLGVAAEWVRSKGLQHLDLKLTPS